MPPSSLDRSNMFDVLYNVPDQIREAVAIGDAAAIVPAFAKNDRFAIFGLGGSAIGGDLLRSYTAATPGADHVDMSVHRGYTVPGFVNETTNVICSSYSGDTEETLSAYDLVRKRTSNIMCITTGGKLGAKATKAGLPVITIPKGYQPRCALAYSFFPLLTVLGRSGTFTEAAVRANAKAIVELERNIEDVRDLYASTSAKNPAFALAKKLHGTAPVIYSASERMDAVNLRWRGQIQENAKQVAFGHVLPEMNHNEINGWQHPKGLTKQFSVVLLRDVDDHKRVQIRFTALADIIKKNVKGIHTVEGTGKSLLSRMFTAIYLGDWVSYHMAALNAVDPSPVPVIMSLKAFIAQK